MVEKIKRYDVEITKHFIGEFNEVVERVDGDFFKVEDVEAILKSAQQLKAEIAALANEIELDLSKGKKPYGPHRIVTILRQLSAV
jgi:reverse gyrase